MTPLQHILAATDLSTPSLHAVDRGFLIAAHSGSRYTVLHAMGLDALAPLREMLGEHVAAVSGKVADERREALERVLSDTVRSRGVDADLRLEAGAATQVVPDLARALAADLILVGAHGRHFLQRFLLGSTASRLLRKSTCPVLVVKEPAREPYRRVLVSIDFSPGAALALQTARAIAPGAEVILLHASHIPFEATMHYAGVSEETIHRYRIEAREQALSQLHRMAKEAGLPEGGYTVIVTPGDPTREILAQEDAYDCDLIVAGKHGTNVTEELLIGSVTKRVLAESRSDVLVVVDSRIPVDGAGLP